MRQLYHPDIDESGQRVDCYLSPEDAVHLQRERAEALGYHYESDDEALDDFIANNWAVWVEA